MSHSQGAIRVGDKIYWVEYNGTIDVLQPHMYNTQEELQANWRRNDLKYCLCQLGNCSIDNNNITQARVAVTYGRGFSWLVNICLNCLVVIGPLSDFYEAGLEDGLPEWYPMSEEMKKYFEWRK